MSARDAQRACTRLSALCAKGDAVLYADETYDVPQGFYVYGRGRFDLLGETEDAARAALANVRR